MPPRTKPSTRQAWLDAMSEDDLLNHIIGMCRLYGLRTAHFAPAWTEKGYRTAVRGDGKGWPDLIIVGYKLIVRELKDAKGRPTPEQATWLKSLQLGGVDTTIWRPSHWYDGTIQRELKALSKRHTDEGGTEMGTVVHLLRRQAHPLAPAVCGIPVTVGSAAVRDAKSLTYDPDKVTCPDCKRIGEQRP